MNANVSSSSRSERSVYEGSTVLISGGSGSIGLELTRCLLGHNPKEIRLLSNDENGLFEARTSLAQYPQVVYKLGDVRETRSVDEATRDCQVVFHAAASKHVVFCEENPYEAVSTNVIGTKNMIDSAIEHKVQRFVFISTDKAVNPIGVMGATKLLGEKLVLLASRATEKPVFSVVRFGNVLGSRGSVLRIFERQVRDGSPLTVTDPQMTRFIMLPRDAAQLVLRAADFAMTGEILVLKMRAVKIGDLADAGREFYSRMYGKDPARMVFSTIGARTGEKMHEELMTLSETTATVETDSFYIVNPNPRRSLSAKRSPNVLEGYSSDVAPLISREETVAMLSRL